MYVVACILYNNSPTLSSSHSLRPNSYQTTNIAQEKLSTPDAKNAWSSRFAHVVRHIKGMAADIHEDQVVMIEQTYPWPPTEKHTVTSLVNFDVSAEAWWKGEPPNIDSVMVARNIVANGLDTDSPASSMIQICHGIVDCICFQEASADHRLKIHPALFKCFFSAPIDRTLK